MRFGIQLPTFGGTAGPSSVVRCARLCEELGYDSVWVNDHIVIPRELDPPYGRILESLSTLAFTAAVTERIRLGTSVLVLPQREPVLAAKQIATLDVLSNGRVICGIAAGYVNDEFRFLRADPRGKGARMEKYLKVLRGLWGGPPFGFEGEFAVLNEATFGPVPVQGAELPVWIAGNGPRAIERAAQIGDAWHPAGVSPSTIGEGVARLRSIATSRRVEVALKCRAGLTEVTKRPEAQRSPASANHPYELFGRVDEVIAELRAFQKAGVGYTVMFMFHSDSDDLCQSLELFAEKVMPHFRD